MNAFGGKPKASANEMARWRDVALADAFGLPLNERRSDYSVGNCPGRGRQRLKTSDLCFVRSTSSVKELAPT